MRLEDLDDLTLKVLVAEAERRIDAQLAAVERYEERTSRAAERLRFQRSLIGTLITVVAITVVTPFALQHVPNSEEIGFDMIALLPAVFCSWWIVLIAKRTPASRRSIRLGLILAIVALGFGMSLIPGFPIAAIVIGGLGALFVVIPDFLSPTS